MLSKSRQQAMNFLREFFIFYTILQIVQCHHQVGRLRKRVIANETYSAQYLRVFTEKYKPYLYEMDDQNRTYAGINYFLIKTVGEKLNKRISFVLATNESRLDNWKPLSKNDIAAGGTILNWSRNKQIAASIPYYQDRLVWCIQHARKYPIFVNFFFIIPFKMWLFISSVVFFFISVLIYALIPFDPNYRYRFHRMNLNHCYLLVVWPACMGVSTANNPKKTTMRLTYWLLLVCPMLYHMMIGAFLYNFMNHQFYLRQISTIDEILSANFRLTGSIDVLKIIQQDSRYPNKSIDNFHLCNNIHTCLEHLKRRENDDMAVGGSQLQILNSQSYSPTKHYCFEEPEIILTYQVSLLLKSNSKLEAQINRIIRHALEAGLFVKWGKDYKYKQEEELYIPKGHMTMSNALTAIIFGLGIGVPVSLVVFFLELIVSSKLKQPNPSKFWLFCHNMILDPGRRFCKYERLFEE